MEGQDQEVGLGTKNLNRYRTCKPRVARSGKPFMQKGQNRGGVNQVGIRAGLSKLGSTKNALPRKQAC